MWLQNRVTNASNRPTFWSTSVDDETNKQQKQWVYDCLPAVNIPQSCGMSDVTYFAHKVLHPYRGNHIGEFRTGLSAPAITTDVSR
ncbi:hypothetical protein FHG87_021785 [Trinorchestia longiramus]|nr:hypothetical protein FHG87_021785 [Trinorchestia longiramus]